MKNTSPNRKEKLLFINTFEPVIPLYSTTFPELEKHGFEPLAVISKAKYRSKNSGDSYNNAKIWIPSYFSRNKRYTALFYWILTPIYLLLHVKSKKVFLTQPPLFFLFGAIISNLFKAPYAVHIMDLYPDLLLKSGFFKKNSFIYLLLSKLTIDLLNKSNGIIVIGRCMEDLLASKGVDENKISLVPNFASNNIRPISRDKNKFLIDNNLSNKFIILYSGNLGKAHRFDTILKAADNLKSYKDIVFVFIGNGVRRKEIKLSSNIILYDFQPEDTLAHSLSSANLHFLSLREGYEGLMVPSKFYGILASGRPVLYEGNSRCEVARVIKEENIGAVIREGDTQNLIQTILEYYKNNNTSKDQGRHAREVFSSNYTESIIKCKYAKTLDKIFSI